MKSAIFSAALTATFGGAARRDSFVNVRANSGVRLWKGTEKVPSAAPNPGLRPFRISTLVNGRRDTKIRIVTDNLAISPNAVGRTNRLLFGGAIAGRTA